VSYREAEEWLGLWGIHISKSQLGRVGGKLDQQQQSLSQDLLKAKAQQPLTDGKNQHRRWWCIEVDGSLVPTQMIGGTEWREVKSAVIYPMHCPSERYYVSELSDKDSFAPLVHGLLRVAGVKQNDRLIGITDGAVWIAELLGDLGVWRHILDVYHAAHYLESLLVGMGWSEPQRLHTRRGLLRGQLDLQAWLNHHAPDPVGLNQDAQKALSYLQKQTLLGHTAYPGFKAEGIEVIGSGQIEGANKHVIGARLKRSGCRWKQPGASAKALVRSQFFSVTDLIPFDQIRLAAFPNAA